MYRGPCPLRLPRYLSESWLRVLSHDSAGRSSEFVSAAEPTKHVLWFPETARPSRAPAKLFNRAHCLLAGRMRPHACFDHLFWVSLVGRSDVEDGLYAGLPPRFRPRYVSERSGVAERDGRRLPRRAGRRGPAVWRAAVTMMAWRSLGCQRTCHGRGWTLRSRAACVAAASGPGPISTEKRPCDWPSTAADSLSGAGLTPSRRP
jgi:hypothetical protein